jgi:hypothetical protein
MKTTPQLLKALRAGLLALSFLHCLSTGNCAPGDTKPVYKDEGNGYFTFAPPKGWTIEKYTDARTKVAFRHPSDKSIFIRLIVREDPEYTFSEMKKDAENTAQQWNEKGASCKVALTEFLGVPATKTSAEIPGAGSTVLWRCLIGGLHFNIQYAAPTKDLLARHLTEVTNSLDSIIVAHPSKVSVEKARKQQAASILRLAELAVERGDKDTACAVLSDGLREFPDDVEIKSRLAEYRGKKQK